MTKNINSLKSLSDITDFMHKLLSEVTTDLEKSSKGNKAASQRVRTGTVKLEKVAKMYRKESILSEKHPSHKAKAKKAAPAKHKAPTNKGHSAPKAAAKSHAPAKKPAAKAHASHASHTAHASHGKSHATQASAKAKAAPVKHKAPAAKKPTAKLPARSR